jgi:hypothetical protein
MPTSTLQRVPVSFTVYDFFAYLVPGSAFLAAVLLFDIWTLQVLEQENISRATVHVPLFTSLSLVYNEIPSNSWLLPTLYGFGVVVVAYITGHLIASVSSLTIDRFLVSRGHGYPYRALFRIPPSADAEWWEISSAFVRGLFFWFNLYLLARYAHVLVASYRGPSGFWESVLAGLADIIGWLIAGFTIVVMLISQLRRRARFHTLRRQPAGKFVWHVGVRVMQVVWFGPYNLIFMPLFSTLNIYRSFDSRFVDVFIQRFKEKFKMDPNQSDTNSFWMSYIYIITHSPPLAAMAVNWRNLYGFARNLATAFYLAFMYSAIWIMIYKDKIVGIDVRVARVHIALPLILFILAAGMLLRYFYLFVAYFSRFVFRSFVFLTETEKSAR